MQAKKMADYAVFAHFWCAIVTLVAIIRNLRNFTEIQKNHIFTNSALWAELV